MHSTVCTVIDLFMCVCHILLINYYYYYMLAASVFYGWPALLTFGYSGNPALLLLVLNCHDCCLFESNKYLLLLLLGHFGPKDRSDAATSVLCSVTSVPRCYSVAAIQDPTPHRASQSQSGLYTRKHHRTVKHIDSRGTVHRCQSQLLHTSLSLVYFVLFNHHTATQCVSRRSQAKHGVCLDAHRRRASRRLY